MATTSGYDHGDGGEKRYQSISHPVDETPIARGVSNEDRRGSDPEKGGRKHSVVASLKDSYGLTPPPHTDSDTDSIKIAHDSTHRKLRPRHIQLIGIGGTIGTALYVQIGRGLMHGGPGSLFLAFTLWYVSQLIRTEEKS